MLEDREMTARPMTETCPKLREAIENGHLRCSVSVGVGSPVATIDTEDLWRLVHAAERSLSTSAAERGMRERAVAAAMNAQLPLNYQWGEDAMEAFNFGKTCAANAIEAALSGIEGEDEQATRAAIKKATTP